MGNPTRTSCSHCLPYLCLPEDTTSIG
ncbi:hypothetical protein GAZ13_07060 [Bacteroides xylanisolvens]|nr:hypothetical protein GAZ13_07060 [Bacteroides xylanisolvens]KAB6458805.1 hypothetical protein GAZ12_06060 [Bacteroides xylanisolvens]